MSNLHNTVDALIKLIADGDEADRCFATKTLGVFKDKRAIPTLISCLRDEDIDVCIDAAEALGKIKDIQAVPALLESLKHDPDGEVKTMVTEALGNIDSGDVTPPCWSWPPDRSTIWNLTVVMTGMTGGTYN